MDQHRRRGSAPETPPDDLVLTPGARLTEGEPGLLSVHAGDRTVTLADTPAVRRLLGRLSRAREPGSDDGDDGDAPVTTDDPTALARLSAGGLVERRAVGLARAARRGAARVLVDDAGTDDVRTGQALELLLGSGVGVTTRAERATHALLVGRGDVDRSRVEVWTRRGLPHLLLVDHGLSCTLGPCVVPGLTSCAHCLDAHLREPAHAPDLARLNAGRQLTTAADPALAAAATAWAVRDLVTLLDGDRPSTWSATVTLTVARGTGLSAQRREWRRHPGCGCAWDEVLRSG